MLASLRKISSPPSSSSDGSSDPLPSSSFLREHESTHKMEPQKPHCRLGAMEAEAGTTTSPWRVLEFYSGIGAMRYSLLRAGIRARVVEAFDINNIANDVYEHNFGHRPFQGNIQILTPADLDKYEAHVWLLSPPCQPYTRQGLQKDSTDARAFSFIKILENVPHMKQPPLMLFVENVVGFETSNTHKHMIEVLSTIGFVTQEFILSPLQFGIPYSRPRYFCLAKREPLSFRNPSFNNLMLSTPSFFMSSKDTQLTNRTEDIDGNHAELYTVDPIIKFLEMPCIIKSQQGYTRDAAASMADGKYDTDEISNSQNSSIDDLDEYFVPPSLIQRWGNAMDIVFPESRRCCCFTKSYYRYVKGTGSLLATSGDINSRLEPLSLKELHLRFFTPREVANLHSFPLDFQFPQDISLRQRYALLGNSMSVAVVAPLFKYLFSEPT